MKFTVVIPCFNASKTIAMALDSLVNQTYSDFEVILVDDASKDLLETMSVVETFKDRLSLSVFRNSSNMNGSFSRNRGIKEAQGEYIAFLDSDDTWVSNRLEMALNLISKGVGKRFVIYGKFELIRSHPTGAILPLRSIRRGELVSEYVFAASQNMQTSTFVLPAEVARDVLFDITLSRHQDSDFMMRAQQMEVDIIFQDVKCATYFFRAGDLRGRVLAGRVNSDFCTKWLELKKEYLSSASIAGYKLTVFSRILYVEGQVLKSIQTLLFSLLTIGFRNLIDLVRTKMYIIYKSRLGL